MEFFNPSKYFLLINCFFLIFIFRSAPKITQLYAVSGQLNDLFSQAGCRKSAVLDMSDLRNYVKKYVEINELQFKNMVRLDPVLHHAVYGKGSEDKETATWDKIYGAITAKMNPAYSVQFAGQSHPVIKKVS